MVAIQEDWAIQTQRKERDQRIINLADVAIERLMMNAHMGPRNPYYESVENVTISGVPLKIHVWVKFSRGYGITIMPPAPRAFMQASPFIVTRIGADASVTYCQIEGVPESMLLSIITDIGTWS